MTTLRTPAVAGTFYPAEPVALSNTVQTLLASADGPHCDSVAPKALIVPHAGYLYSGAIAASAYARLRPARGTVRRVVLLGPAHRVPVRGLALPGVDAFATPLGTIALDRDAIARVRGLPQVVESAPAHALEHSLEVHLPFLQCVLDDFTLVPFVVGDARREEVAEVLDALWGGDETLIVVSTDLSHYLSYDDARRIDNETAAMVVDLRSDIDQRRACGGTPLNGLMLAALRRKLSVQQLDLGNSGDTAGTRDHVVGYGAFAVLASDSIPANAGTTLLALARSAIARRFDDADRSATPMTLAWLQQPGATFVTLTRGGELRGCIGSLEAKRALGVDVRENAVAAAFRDPRFPPLPREEWSGTQIEISLLSPLEPVQSADEEALCALLRPGIDGVLIEYGHHRSTFLPQVWEQLPEPRAFLQQLRRKAGLPADFMEPGFKAWRYTVAKWRERDPAHRSNG